MGETIRSCVDPTTYVAFGIADRPVSGRFDVAEHSCISVQLASQTSVSCHVVSFRSRNVAVGWRQSSPWRTQKHSIEPRPHWLGLDTVFLIDYLSQDGIPRLLAFAGTTGPLEVLSVVKIFPLRVEVWVELTILVR